MPLGVRKTPLRRVFWSLRRSVSLALWSSISMARSDSADALCGSPRSSSEAICASPRSGVDHSGSMDVRQYQRLLDRVAPDEEVGQESIGVMVGIGMALCALGPLMIAVLAVSVLTTLDSSILAALLTVLTARFARSFINASLPGSCSIHRLLDHPWRGEMRQVLCVLLLLAPVIAVLELSKGPYPPTPGPHVAQGAASWGWAGSGAVTWSRVPLRRSEEIERIC